MPENRGEKILEEIEIGGKGKNRLLFSFYSVSTLLQTDENKF